MQVNNYYDIILLYFMITHNKHSKKRFRTRAYLFIPSILSYHILLRKIYDMSRRESTKVVILMCIIT